jgi:MOSC domain-containing protein YiiM
VRVAVGADPDVYRLGQGSFTDNRKAMDHARIEAVQVSRGGVPKTSVFEALIAEDGLDGDSQRDLRYHGGPDRAVVLFSLEVIRALQAEGHPIGPGRTGENLTVSGLDWTAIRPGTMIQVGEARLQVTRFATPCRKIGGAFLGGDHLRISQDRHPGFSRVCARVVTGGIVRPGDRVAIISDAGEGGEGSSPDGRAAHRTESAGHDR